jgi:hypothetical protein
LVTPEQVWLDYPARWSFADESLDDRQADLGGSAE